MTFFGTLDQVKPFSLTDGNLNLDGGDILNCESLQSNSDLSFLVADGRRFEFQIDGASYFELDQTGASLSSPLNLNNNDITGINAVAGRTGQSLKIDGSTGVEINAGAGVGNGIKFGDGSNILKTIDTYDWIEYSDLFLLTTGGVGFYGYGGAVWIDDSDNDLGYIERNNAGTGGVMFRAPSGKSIWLGNNETTNLYLRAGGGTDGNQIELSLNKIQVNQDITIKSGKKIIPLGDLYIQPTLANAGIYLQSDSGVISIYSNSNQVEIVSGSQQLIFDYSSQVARLNGNTGLTLFTSSNNGNINIQPNGTGKVAITSPMTVKAINSSADALPVASETYRGQVRTVEGGTGVADVHYICLKDDLDAYSWVQVATG